jgi:hypothetical protein
MAGNRGLVGRCGSLLATIVAVGVAFSATSCGGGGGSGYAAQQMVLTEYLYVDRSLQPSFPTGVLALPRNAMIVFQFSELVDPGSVNTQTIQLRYGPTFQSVPKGSFQVDGSRVIFDPTVSSQGTPNPFGFEAVTQYNVDLPANGDANDVVQNLDQDPLLTSFFSSFTTGEGFLRELVPPEILRAYFIPAQDQLTKLVPGNSILALEFTEAMDPLSFVLSAGSTPSVTDTIDIRYADLLAEPNINSTNNLENVPISGVFTHNPAASTYFFTPTFSWGNKKFIFNVTVFQGVTDLSGNLLINPRSFGPFTCDGLGIQTGKVLSESFDSTTDMDGSTTNGDWGSTTKGTLQGAAITSRRTYIAGHEFGDEYNAGQYNPIVDPLIGAALNQYVTNVNPPTDQGRRVMYAFSDADLGQSGTVTAASWGPDSNATFAAQYPEVILRIGYQKTSSLNLAGTFSGNYLGSPLILYKGPYSVQQAINVGDEYPPPQNNSGFAQQDPLYNNTGYVDWPTPTSFFDYDEGDPGSPDVVLVFDASVQEGDTFQQIRTWFAVTAPGSGVLISGFPQRRMYATFEEDVPNPPASFAAGILNPEPSCCDTAFTFTRRVSLAQSLFYTPDATDAAGNSYNPPFSEVAKRTFGVKSNYLPAILVPALQSGGAQILVEYQGATALEVSSNRSKPNEAFPFTAWTTSVNDCDTFPYIRWRITLTSNLISNQVAKLGSIQVPILQRP